MTVMIFIISDEVNILILIPTLQTEQLNKPKTTTTKLTVTVHKCTHI
jgi:hypothetical protein